jgi:hypothetical protein
MIDYWTQPAESDNYKNVCGENAKIILYISTNKSVICVTEPLRIHNYLSKSDDNVRYLVWLGDEIVAECRDREAAKELALFYVNRNK